MKFKNKLKFHLDHQSNKYIHIINQAQTLNLPIKYLPKVFLFKVKKI